MATFPASIPAPYVDYRKRWKRRTHRSEFDAGYEQTRPMWTRTRREWAVVFNLTGTELATLVAFFEGSDVAYGGYAFEWTDPIDGGGAINVRLVEDMIESEYLGNDLYQVVLTFMEV